MGCFSAPAVCGRFREWSWKLSRLQATRHSRPSGFYVMPSRSDCLYGHPSLSWEKNEPGNLLKKRTVVSCQPCFTLRASPDQDRLPVHTDGDDKGNGANSLFRSQIASPRYELYYHQINRTYHLSLLPENKVVRTSTSGDLLQCSFSFPLKGYLCGKQLSTL